MTSDRIYTTHTGSLPWPSDLEQLVAARLQVGAFDEALFSDCRLSAVRRLVTQQLEAEIDVLSDGEAGRASYMDYIGDGRFNGIAIAPGKRNWAARDLIEYPVEGAMQAAAPYYYVAYPILTGRVSRNSSAPGIEQEIDAFRAALAGHEGEYRQAFLCALSPGNAADLLWDFQAGSSPFYSSYEELLFALAEVLSAEYRAVVRAGLTLQVDCPDLAIGGQYYVPDRLDAYLPQLQMRVAALHEALKRLPEDRIRVHVCWGNYPGSHLFDPPLSFLLPTLLQLPGALALEGANPRHAWEWEILQQANWPDGKPLLLGVIDTKTTCVETPELVAQRLVRVARSIGRENLLASTDCGFNTFVGRSVVPPAVAWLKLAALVEGARLATQQLW